MPELRAHRLLAWAGQGAVQHRLAEVLFRSYFAEGRDLCDPGVLVAAAGEAGLDPALAAEAVRSGAGAESVEADLRAAQDAEITGAPLYVLGGRFDIPGAQPPGFQPQRPSNSMTSATTALGMGLCWPGQRLWTRLRSAGRI